MVPGHCFDGLATVRSANQLQLIRRALLFTGAGLMVAAAGLPGFAAPKQTARTVTNGFVRSNVLLPIGGKKAVSNPVPQDLSDLSGWTREELEVGLEKQYDVDVADVTRFLYSEEGEAFLKESINGNYHPYYSCLLYTSPSPRDTPISRMPSSA